MSIKPIQYWLVVSLFYKKHLLLKEGIIILPQSDVNSAVGFAHRSAKVPNSLGSGQKRDWQHDAGADQVDDAEVLDQEEVDRPHLELAHPDVVNHQDVARHGRDDDGSDQDALKQSDQNNFISSPDQASIQ